MNNGGPPPGLVAGKSSAPRDGTCICVSRFTARNRTKSAGDVPYTMGACAVSLNLKSVEDVVCSFPSFPWVALMDSNSAMDRGRCCGPVGCTNFPAAAAMLAVKGVDDRIVCPMQRKCINCDK